MVQFLAVNNRSTATVTRNAQHTYADGVKKRRGGRPKKSITASEMAKRRWAKLTAAERKQYSERMIAALRAKRAKHQKPPPPE